MIAPIVCLSVNNIIKVVISKKKTLNFCASPSSELFFCVCLKLYGPGTPVHTVRYRVYGTGYLVHTARYSCYPYGTPPASGVYYVLSTVQGRTVHHSSPCIRIIYCVPGTRYSTGFSRGRAFFLFFFSQRFKAKSRRRGAPKVWAQ